MKNVVELPVPYLFPYLGFVLTVHTEAYLVIPSHTFQTENNYKMW